jgi:hypothetical protein
VRLRDIVIAVLQEGTYSDIGFNVEASAGLNDANEPNIEVNIRIDRNLSGNDLSSLRGEIYDAIVHEMTHLGQADMEEVTHNQCGPEYFACMIETEAFVSGFLARAEMEGRDVTSIIDKYLQDQLGIGNLKPGQDTIVKDTWLEQLPKLNAEIESSKRSLAMKLTTNLLELINTGESKSGEIDSGYYEHIAEEPDFEDEDIDTLQADYFIVDYSIRHSSN